MTDPATRELERLREALVDFESLRPEISRWSVGMHVHHCALSMIEIARSLTETEPRDDVRAPSLVCRLVLATGRIPRGRAKSPEPVHPVEGVTREEVRALLDEAEEAVERAREVDSGAWFRHAIFGVLTKRRALRFLQVHNRHHLRIIRDIRKAR